MQPTGRSRSTKWGLHPSHRVVGRGHSEGLLQLINERVGTAEGDDGVDEEDERTHDDYGDEAGC